MAFTVGQAIAKGREEARQDNLQVRHPNEVLFMKSRSLPSPNSEVNLTKFIWIKSQWVLAGR
jgi:hypothetical protein